MDTIQKDVFLNKEGDGWFERNCIVEDKLKEKIEVDPVLQVVEKHQLHPKRVLEIGASNGWRLAVLKERIPDIVCSGVEPSKKAVESAYPNIDMRQGTADALPFENDAFDMVVFGFCLYLCDRADLFKIAAEADRVLSDNGYMILYDFYTESPYRNPYAHSDGMFSYKMDYSCLFSWNPAYRLIDNVIMPHPGTHDHSPDNLVGIAVLHKNMGKGWPSNKSSDE